MAFVALKAVKWALKGQDLASDTVAILLANAYHWNPCWNRWTMSHFQLLLYIISQNTTFFVGHTLPWLGGFNKFQYFCLFLTLASFIVIALEGSQSLRSPSPPRWIAIIWSQLPPKNAIYDLISIPSIFKGIKIVKRFFLLNLWQDILAWKNAPHLYYKFDAT